MVTSVRILIRGFPIEKLEPEGPKLILGCLPARGAPEVSLNLSAGIEKIW